VVQLTEIDKNSTAQRLILNQRPEETLKRFILNQIAEDKLMKSTASRNFLVIAALAILVVAGGAFEARGQGRSRRAIGLDKKCAKFVNCHDASEGRLDGRGPGRGGDVDNWDWRRGRRDPDLNRDRSTRRRHRDIDGDETWRRRGEVDRDGTWRRRGEVGRDGTWRRGDR